MAVMQYDQVLVSWKLPKENADKVQSYTVFYQSNEDAEALESHVVYISLVVRKPDFCICDREADQRLCFRYTDSTTPLLPIYEISSF